MSIRGAVPSVHVAIVVLGGVLVAQQPQPAPQVFRAETEAVVVTVTAVDRQGRHVTDVRREELRVFEDTVPQEIAQFEADAETPISLVLVVDTSRSMVDKLEDVADALGHLLDLTRPEDELTLMRFSGFVEVIAAAGEDRLRFRSALGRLRADGGTALYDAVVDGVEHARRGRHRKKALVAITDGNDTASGRDFGEARDAVRRSEVLLYALGIGHGTRGTFGHAPFGHDSLARPDEVDLRTLRGLAEPSGGRAYRLEQAHRGGVDLVDQAVVDIVRELRLQYTIAYYSTNTRKDSKFRRIKVETTRPGVTIRARAGYWAPRANP